MKHCPKCGKEYRDTITLCPADGAVLAKDDDNLAGKTLAGKYRLDELISEGGMGAVYRGTHILMDKVVAIKVMHPALAADDKIVARFSREAKAASRISHPHALNVTDFGEAEDGTVFLVMEYLRGRTLKQVIREEGPLALPRLVEIIRQVAGALEAAHSEGVVHRDLKSDNIMLVDNGDGSDWAKVLDFGIAKIQEPVGQDPALTAPNLIIGTPQYMSPEQCSQASEIDARSDIYSLGVIVFEALAGHVPFTGESPTAVMMKHLQEPPPEILKERGDVPAEVGRVIEKAMAKRPEDRFQTVSELAEALALASTGEQAVAPAAILAGTAGDAAADQPGNRIVVPTGAREEARKTVEMEHGETTVIQARRQPAAAPGQDARGVAARQQYSREVAAGGPNLWRILIPSAVGLLVCFIVVYALTRNSGSAQPGPGATASPQIAVDPNSQPVRPVQPATGRSEQTLKPTATATPPVVVAINANDNANANTNARANANRRGNGNAARNSESGDEPSEGNSGEPERRTNANRRRQAARDRDTDNSNDENSEPEPSPSPARRNRDANRPPTPETSPSDTDTVTPPTVGRKKPTPSPSRSPEATPRLPPNPVP